MILFVRLIGIEHLGPKCFWCDRETVPPLSGFSFYNIQIWVINLQETQELFLENFPVDKVLMVLDHMSVVIEAN